jgi:hypothetical protein
LLRRLQVEEFCVRDFAQSPGVRLKLICEYAWRYQLFLA